MSDTYYTYLFQGPKIIQIHVLHTRDTWNTYMIRRRRNAVRGSERHTADQDVWLVTKGGARNRAWIGLAVLEVGPCGSAVVYAVPFRDHLGRAAARDANMLDRACARLAAHLASSEANRIA